MMYTLKHPVGPGCPNDKADVQTVQMLLQHSGYYKRFYGCVPPANGNFSRNIADVIQAFQSEFVPNEERPYRGCIYPGSRTLAALTQMAVTSGHKHVDSRPPADKEWESLSPEQREDWIKHVQQAGYTRENAQPFFHEYMSWLRARSDEHAGFLRWAGATVNSTDQAFSWTGLALSSAQALAFWKLCKRTNFGIPVLKTCSDILIGSGSAGTKFMARVANAFLAGPFAASLDRLKTVLGRVGFIMVFLKAGVLLSQGKWGPAFAEIIKGIVSVGIPVIGFIDAIFSLLDALFPALSTYPIYRFIRGLNPADIVGDCIKTLCSVCDILWTAWCRDDWDILDKFRAVQLPAFVASLKMGIEAILDLFATGWRAIQWILNILRDTLGASFSPKPAAVAA